MTTEVKEKVFRDPVHNFIRVQDQVILDLIGTSEFQRLRRIKQLGVASAVFHGAEHSRFSHSLGVYEIARQFADHLEKFYPTQEPGDGLWDPSERLVLLTSALLHDLGHGPYCTRLNTFSILIMSRTPNKLFCRPKLKLIKFCARSHLIFRPR